MSPVLIALLLAGCGDGGGDDIATGVTPSASSSASSAPVESTPVSDVPGEGTGTPKTDPCTLLTVSMAEGALGVPVGAPTTTKLPGNVTCSYTPADGTTNIIVLLTTYAASGKAALLTATAEFPDAREVPGLGDAALVSRRGRAIGVAVDDLLFGMSLVRADSAPNEVSENQLITLARTVVEAR